MHKLAVLANGKIGKNVSQVSWRQDVTEFPLQKTVLFPGKYNDSWCCSQLRAQHRLVLCLLSADGWYTLGLDSWKTNLPGGYHGKALSGDVHHRGTARFAENDFDRQGSGAKVDASPSAVAGGPSRGWAGNVGSGDL